MTWRIYIYERLNLSDVLVSGLMFRGTFFGNEGRVLLLMP